MAMEYVTGEPIDAWCRTHDADLATRLRLFCDVCEAVMAYAHGHLIVHRDLQAVEHVVDSDGRVRLLDFGIARCGDRRRGRGTNHDRADDPRLCGARTTRKCRPDRCTTDVYALGELLFELLTGHPARGASRGRRCRR